MAYSKYYGFAKPIRIPVCRHSIFLIMVVNVAAWLKVACEQEGNGCSALTIANFQAEDASSKMNETRTNHPTRPSAFEDKGSSLSGVKII